MKNFIRVISIVLVIATIGIMFTACGSKKEVMTYTVDGKDYSITAAEYDVFMKVVKMNFFINNGYQTSFDTALWGIKADGEQTYGQYYDNYVQNLMKTTLIEKYLFDKYGLSLSKETTAKYKSEIKEQNKTYGGPGAYKQLFGYTCKSYYDLYQTAVDKSTEIINYLYKGDNAVDKVTAEELEKYYKDNYVGYQYIYLDMNNKIKKAEKDGVEYYIGLDAKKVEYYVLVTIGDDGVVTMEQKGRVDGKEIEKDKEGKPIEVVIVDFANEKLTDEEKAEKTKLPDLIIQELDKAENPADFKELLLKYTDDFNGYKFENGVFISNTGYIVNNDSVMDAAKELKVGEHTKAISVSDSKYYYIVKKIDLKEKAYEDEEYEELFTQFNDNCMYEKYQAMIDELAKEVKVDKAMVDKYHMATTFLSSYVDYYLSYMSQLGGLLGR